MNQRIFWILAGLLLGIGLSAPSAAATPADELFQRALVKESAERDPDGAIPLYQRAIDEAGSNGDLAAQARLRIAISFEKLGKPEYAEGMYRQILEQKPGAPSDVAQQARASLYRIEADRRLVAGSSVTALGTWIHPFYPTRYSLLLGPHFLIADKMNPALSLELGMRYRFSSPSRSTGWFLEAAGFVPLGDSLIARQTASYQSTTDSALLSLRYQISVGVIGELPHGHQRVVLPEAGLGLLWTSAQTDYTSGATSGENSQTTLRPYLGAGLQLYPDHVVSWLLQARYVSLPYSQTANIGQPIHAQSFNVPSSQWSVGIVARIKIGHRKWVLQPSS